MTVAVYAGMLAGWNSPREFSTAATVSSCALYISILVGELISATSFILVAICLRSGPTLRRASKGVAVGITKLK